jgi:ornithine carbamoyltransferase
MMSKKDFLQIPDLDAVQTTRVLDLAASMKAGEYTGRPLEGKTLAMIFRKSSTRTRVSFEVGTFQLGGHALFLSDRDSQLGRGEPVRDTARVLSGYVDGVMIRTFDHEEVEELARFASVPVINGLTDLLHPCQILADLQTVREEFGPDLAPIRVAWIGDGNNVANSWINAARMMEFELRLAWPDGYEADADILRRGIESGHVQVASTPLEACEGAHVVTTDVWASMGQEDEAAERMRAFAGYCVDDDLMAAADSKAIFLHCLPAHRGEEVTDEVIEGPRARVFPEAENRLHAQKALMVELMG